MNLLILVSIVGTIVGASYYVAALIAGFRFAQRAAVPPGALPKIAPRVALLKPLHGIHESLAANIMSFFEIAYPRVEYWFAVSTYDDPAAEVPAALRARYQFAKSTLIVGKEPGCANHKIAKVIRMADRADKADILVMSDADISVDRDYLQRIVSELQSDERIGVVTCAYRARPSGSLASRLEALFVNTDFAPQVMLSSELERTRHALGATIAIKRAALESFGGFRAVKDFLADDFYLGKLASDHGWKVKLSSSLVTLTFEEKSLASVWDRQVRWARTVRCARPVSIATILCQGTFWALVLMLATRFSPLSIGTLVAMLSLRLATSALMIRRVLKLPELLRDVWLVPLKDLMAVAIWIASLTGKNVTWAGHHFRIARNGTMHDLALGRPRPKPQPTTEPALNGIDSSASIDAGTPIPASQQGAS